MSRDEGGLSRRDFLGAGAVMATSVLAGGLPAWATAPRGRPPSIVYVLADDLGYGGLGAYGQRTMRTPRLDELSREGIRFTNCHSGGPICAPSRCALLTGMHAGHTRVRDNSFTETGNEPELLPEDTTVGQVMRAAGYRTGIFGKWGFGPDDAYVPLPTGGSCRDDESGGPQGDLNANVGHPSHPLQKGFDEFVGFVRHHHATEGYYANYLWDGNRRVLLPENRGEARKTYTPDLYVRRALQFMDRHRDEPFFLLLCPQLVHWPNHVPTTEPYDAMPWPEDMKRYAAMHTRLDTYVGMVRDKLVELGLADDALMVFTSDNGPTPEERELFSSGSCAKRLNPSPESAVADATFDTTGGLRGSKHSLYEGGHRVPMIVWGPGIVRSDARTVMNRPWASWDVLSTLADFAGVTAPADVDGVSVRGWITGEPGRDVSHPPLYWERPPYLGASADGSRPVQSTYAEAARRGRWKAVRYAPGTDPKAPSDQWQFELYDLDADPGERNDIAARHPDLRTEFEAIMAAAHRPQPYPRRRYAPRQTGDGWLGGASRRRRRRRSRHRHLHHHHRRDGSVFRHRHVHDHRTHHRHRRRHRRRRRHKHR